MHSADQSIPADAALLTDLSAALIDECRHRAAPEDVFAAAQAVGGIASRFSDDPTLHDWQGWWNRYRSASAALTAALDRDTSIARKYASMDAFWTDAAAQADGTSSHSFWDVYEHGGRRRLEAIVAETYASESALLVNCGMSAIAVALDHALSAPAARVVTGQRGYFETGELLAFHAARGVEVVRLDLQSADIAASLAAVAPDLVLFEPVTNSFDATPARVRPAWFDAAPDARFLCDNTLHGAALCWSTWLADVEPAARARFVVAESLAKYVCNEAMSGVLYGDAPLIDALRLRARASGQQLQGRALNAIRCGAIRSAPARIALHRRNAGLLATALADIDAIVVQPATDAAEQRGASFVPDDAGCLVFVRITGERGSPAAHRAILDRWKAAIGSIGGDLDIRAGFGWPTTTARVYEGAALNQPDAPTYLRISAGVEPAATVERYGALLRMIVTEEIALAPALR